jgi:cytidine deaminase
MISHSLTIAYSEYASEKELNIHDQELLTAARQASKLAYAPYSQFYVGAAILLSDGQVYSGNNQENAAYPSGLCAERVAVFSASSQNPGMAIQSIAIVANSNHFNVFHPITPCGGCRQVLAEYEAISGVPMRILMQGNSGSVWVVEGISNLLPLMFQGEQLKK